MTKTEYDRKNFAVLDRFKRTIKAGDLVVVNNNYRNRAEVGKAIWITGGGRLRVDVNYSEGSRSYTESFYRYPETVIKINSDALITKEENKDE